MDKLPLVSIALATFNGDKFLRKQLDSIARQTYSNIEVVISDDCSTDTTVEILDEYRSRYGFNYVVNVKNRGFVANFAHAISLCTGDFIALADQDDIWLPDKIETLVREIEDYSLIYTDASLINAEDAKLSGSLIETSGVAPVTGRNFKYFVCNSCVTGCTALFRRDLLTIALPIPESEAFHDWWLSVAASRRGGVKYLDQKLVQYRQHDSNFTGANIKTGIVSRILAHLRPEVKLEKMLYYRLLENRAINYLRMRDRLGLTDGEIRYLNDIREYAVSLLDPRFHIKSFLLAWKLKEWLFPSAKSVEKYVFVFSKLLNKHLV